MIMTKNCDKIILTIFTLLLYSCETLQDIAGLEKPNLETDLIDQTPELVLPPDFNKVARPGRLNRVQPNPNAFEINDQYQNQAQYQSVRPQVKNYIAPQINIQSSPTPSDSLERFKENKKFTVGQWVYGQYVKGFKQGNLYYRPIYDKGYNFSRRYVPDHNVSSFLTSPQMNNGLSNDAQVIQENTDVRDIDNLPIID